MNALDKRLIYGFLGVLAVVGVIATFDRKPVPPRAPPPPAPSLCASDWSLCKDNTELLSKYKNMSGVRFDCKGEAERRASYGKPEWDGFPFDKAQPGDSGPKTGVIVLIDVGSRFHNGSGAMVKSTVTCRYDLKAKRVVDLAINL